MAFSGAPQVVHVAPPPQGNDANSGVSWSAPVRSISRALVIVKTFPSVPPNNPEKGNALILIGPGRYVGADARATIDVPRVRFQGAGRGTVLEENLQNALFQVAADHVEFADLCLLNSSAQADAFAIFNPAPLNTRVGVSLTRCWVTGKKAIQLSGVRDILIQWSTLEGTHYVVLFGNQGNSPTEEYACVCSNSDFRAINSTAANTQAVIVNGGELTAMNCNFAASVPSGTTTVEALRVDNGGQIALTNCAVTTGKGSASSIHFGVNLVGSGSRMNVTGCFVLAQGGNTTNSRSVFPKDGDPGYDTTRMKASASLLSPIWPS